MELSDSHQGDLGSSLNVSSEDKGSPPSTAAGVTRRGFQMPWSRNSDERSRLINNDILTLNKTLSQAPDDDEDALHYWTGGAPEQLTTKNLDKSRRTLGWFAGVFIAVYLGQTATLLFQRVGFVVGQAGLIQAILQFFLAYMILYMTILSICAISTNGAVEGGGAYFMISRALGPEFGGSIGFLFFIANIISCALYVSGCVEGLIENFGPGGQLVDGGIPAGSAWWNYLYATAILFLCLVVCLIGSAMFARTSTFILVIVLSVTVCVIVSFIIKGDFCADFSEQALNCMSKNNVTMNSTTEWCDEHHNTYTGFSWETFKENLNSKYSKDYTSSTDCADLKMMGFASVFAVLFSSVTGIMNGANMSGELKEPGKAIPKGTLAAATFTLSTYIILVFLTAATSSRELLLYNYNYLQQVSFWPPLLVIGIFAATLSAALGNLIGASRILEALAKDNLFWSFLKPATITSCGGNPFVSVLISWFLVQIVLLAGSLNAISPLASVFFLLSYAATNLACLSLDLASAPNFRPTFKYFSWHTALIGLVGCLVMCFFIDVAWASSAIIICLLLIILLHFRSIDTSWGSISQALIFHQVRKYLLLLDSRKDHVKFWRPQMLLLVANPRSCTPLIEFINDLKKSGLYVIGHVKKGSLEGDIQQDPATEEYLNWLHLVDILHVKAFVEVTLANTIREGMHHLVRISGLGGMKPNTICLGFHEESTPEDLLQQFTEKRLKKRFYYTSETPTSANIHLKFPDLRSSGEPSSLSVQEYVAMISDAIKMNKNVCLFRHFDKLDKNAIIKSKNRVFIDVWPVNFFQPQTANFFDNTQLFMLQLACILNMVHAWKPKTQMRVFLCVDAENDDTLRKERKLDQLLQQLRIRSKVQIIMWDHLTCMLKDDPAGGYRPASLSSAVTNPPSEEELRQRREPWTDSMPPAYVHGVRDLIKGSSVNTAVSFLYLPRPPAKSDLAEEYMKNLAVITQDLPPTVYVHGIHPVTSTTL